MKEQSETLAFWLLPAQPARQFFAALIEELAERFDAPAFEPHLTLFGRPFDPAFDFHGLDRLSFPAWIELETNGLHHSAQYSKTLFVRFKPRPELMKLRAAMGAAEEDDYDPHLSLLYQKMPAGALEELSRSIKIAFDSMRFATMKVIRTPARLQSREGIEAWRTVWERSLG